MGRMVFKPGNFWKKRTIKEPKKRHQGGNKKQGFWLAGNVWDA